MKRTLLILVLMTPLFIKAQGILDVYDFSTSFYQGTAKSAAMGNAMGAVGQDFSSISINPAGLGLFRHSSFVFTPGLTIANTKSEFNGYSNSATEIRLPLNNIGAAVVFQENDEILKSVNFGIGMNRINNYTQETFASGLNTTSSLVDAYFIDMAASDINNADELYSFSPNYIYPLWETYVIGASENNLYTTTVPDGYITQQRGMLKKGYTDEISISLSFNLCDKWFIGLSLDIPRLYRYTTNDYKEVNQSNNPTFRNFQYWMQEEIISTNGWGVGGKFGLIGYPAKWLRLGLSFHTPTLYDIDESWRTYTTAQYKSDPDPSPSSHSNIKNYDTPTSNYSYKLTTPLRFDASAAFIFGNKGMITFDYEFVNYRNAYLSCRDYDYSYINRALDDIFKATSNFRLGGEYRVKSVCFRAGYAFYGSPYGLSEKNFRTNNFSLGIGHTIHSFTIDAAYVYGRTTNSYYVYAPYSDQIPEADFENTNIIDETKNLHQIVMSLKFKLD